VRGVCPWEQVVDAAHRMAVDEAGENIGEIGLRIDLVELTGLDQRGDNAPVLAAAVGPGEERILAIERNRSVILPISGRRSRSIIAGTPSTAAASGASAASGA
jgi:hypothetical protein